MIKPVNHFTPERVCAQPFGVPQSKFHSFDSFKSFVTRYLLLLLFYFKFSFWLFILSWDTHTVVWLDEACARTASLWLHATSDGGQGEEQEQGSSCPAAGTAPPAHQISCWNWANADCWEADVTGMVPTGKALSSSGSVGSLRLWTQRSNLPADEHPASPSTFSEHIQRLAQCLARPNKSAFLYLFTHDFSRFSLERHKVILFPFPTITAIVAVQQNSVVKKDPKWRCLKSAVITGKGYSAV